MKNIFAICILVTGMVIASGMNSMKANVSVSDQQSYTLHLPIPDLLFIIPDVYLASSNDFNVMPAWIDFKFIEGEPRGSYLQIDKVAYENNKSLQLLKHDYNHRENI